MSVQSKRLLLTITVSLIFSLLIIPGLAAEAEKSTLEVHFIDVGQGDSILLHSTGGTDILIDAGYPANGAKVLEYLRSLKITELDLVIGTHPHADHIGGLPEVLLGIPVKKIIDPGVAYASGVYENYLTVIKDKKIPFQTVLVGDTLIAEDTMLTIEVLAPYKELLSHTDDLNDVSVVIRASYGEVSFLLVGDASFSTEDLFFANRVKLKSTILKVGHHGSKYSTGEMFLMSVEPEVGVITVGENTYGHPTEEVLQRLRSQNVTVYRTDLNGTVVIATDGKSYEVKLEKVPAVVNVDTRLNINTAPMGDILDLPGMTVQLAQEIVKYRERFGVFLGEKELLRVKYMTPELLEQILPYIKLTE